MNAEWPTARLGGYQSATDKAAAEAEAADAVGRIWRKDASLWKSEEEPQKIIRNALGWLTVAAQMVAAVDELVAFSDEIRSAGFKHLMLCGMGGSSLWPEVMRQTFSAQQGYPELLVLDSTDPDVLSALARRIDIEKCLFIIASKSGTTTEPLVFYKYWYDQVKQRKENPGDSFVAITDPGTRMVEMATADNFRRIFLNPADIGGRYSALSYFGMVPAALMGLDITKLLARATAMSNACQAKVPTWENPGVQLGAIMGECANAGRDKLTIVADSRVAALGLWIEQLVAESTGKEGKGIVPISGEPLGPVSVYGEDRLFVSIAVEQLDPKTKTKLETLEAAGHPVVYLLLKDTYDLGAECFLWEIATAFAGWRLGINPFDQPNVQESKDATKELLDHYTAQGKLKEQLVLVTDGVLSIYVDEGARTRLPASSVTDALRGHCASAKAGDYTALLDYIEETPEIEATVQAIRTHLRDATKCATTTGYGPRFLHSTGQLHKGGPNTGVFIQVTAADKVDLPIPNETYTFSILKQAQALGDFRSLVAHGRRALRLDLGADTLAGLKRFQEIIELIFPVAATPRRTV